MRIASTQPLSTWQRSFWIGLAVIGGGAILSIITLKGFDLAEFSGWPLHQPVQKLGAFRHPVCTTPALFSYYYYLIGLRVYQPDWRHLLFGLFAFLYIRVGIHFEEKN